MACEIWADKCEEAECVKQWGWELGASCAALGEPGSGDTRDESSLVQQGNSA